MVKTSFKLTFPYVLWFCRFVKAVKKIEQKYFNFIKWKVIKIFWFLKVRKTTLQSLTQEIGPDFARIDSHELSYFNILDRILTIWTIHISKSKYFLGFPCITCAIKFVQNIWKKNPKVYWRYLRQIKLDLECNNIMRESSVWRLNHIAMSIGLSHLRMAQRSI